MSIMPSYAFVAKALYSVGADVAWEDISPDEQQAHMLMAKVAISAILTWQAQHKPDGANRYGIEPSKDANDDSNGYALYDRIVGLNTTLGVIYDALLAQQIVDVLNRPRVPDQMPQMPKEPVQGD